MCVALHTAARTCAATPDPGCPTGSQSAEGTPDPVQGLPDPLRARRRHSKLSLSKHHMFLTPVAPQSHQQRTAAKRCSRREVARSVRAGAVMCTATSSWSPVCRVKQTCLDVMGGGHHAWQRPHRPAHTSAEPSNVATAASRSSVMPPVMPPCAVQSAALTLPFRVCIGVLSPSMVYACLAPLAAQQAPALYRCIVRRTYILLRSPSCGRLLHHSCLP